MNNYINNYYIFSLISIFILIVFVTIILLILYYLTPNNYLILSLQEEEKNKLKKIDQFNFIIEPKSTIKLDFKNYIFSISLDTSNITITNSEIPLSIYNDYNSSDSNQINLIIKNVIKSQSFIYTYNDLIQARYNSEVYINNNSNNLINILVNVYSK